MLAMVLPLVVVFGLFSMYSAFFGSAAKSGAEVYIILIAIIIAFSGGTLLFLRRKHLI
jgi:cytochrome c biogenesis protein CcdA